MADSPTTDDPRAGVLDADGALGQDTLRRMTSDARNLLSLVRDGDLAIDPDSAYAIAAAYEDMVDDIYWIKVGLLTAGQYPQLGTSPYSRQVAEYQHEAAESFKTAVLELESICRQCARAYRQAATRYVELEQRSADRFTGLERGLDGGSEGSG